MEKGYPSKSISEFSANSSLHSNYIYSKYSYLRVKLILNPNDPDIINELINVYITKEEYSHCGSFLIDIIKSNPNSEISTNIIKNAYDHISLEMNNPFFHHQITNIPFSKILSNISKPEKISFITHISQINDGYESLIFKHWLIIYSDEYVQNMAIKIATKLINNKIPYDEFNPESLFIYERLLPDIFLRYFQISDTPNPSCISILKEFLAKQNDILIYKINALLSRDEISLHELNTIDNCIESIESIHSSSSRILSQRKLSEFTSKFPFFRRNSEISYSTIGHHLKNLITVQTNTSFLLCLLLRHSFSFIKSLGLPNRPLADKFILILSLPCISTNKDNSFPEFKYNLQNENRYLSNCQNLTNIVVHLLWVERLIDTIVSNNQTLKSFLDWISPFPQMKDLCSLICMQATRLIGADPCTYLGTPSGYSNIIPYINLIEKENKKDITQILEVLKMSLDRLPEFPSFSDICFLKLSDHLLLFDLPTKSLISESIFACQNDPCSLLFYCINFLIIYISKIFSLSPLEKEFASTLLILIQFQWPIYSFLLDPILSALKLIEIFPLKSLFEYIYIDDVIEGLYGLIQREGMKIDIYLEESMDQSFCLQTFIGLISRKKISDIIIINFISNNIDNLFKLT